MIERIFLVGCARSGTTLLQSMLAAHPMACSFPETQFFPELIGDLPARMFPGSERCASPAGHRIIVAARELLKSYRLKVGIAYPRHQAAKNVLESFRSALNLVDCAELKGTTPLSIRSYASEFVRILDCYARKHSKICWVEKSPNHLYYIDQIERYLEEPKFLHIVRKGEDVVASISDAANKNATGNDFSADIDVNIERWNSAVRVTEAHCARANHHLVRYDDLISQPLTELQAICQFIGIPYSDDMLEKRAIAAGALIRGDEAWKNGARSQLELRPSKFDSLFDSRQRSYIQKRLVQSPCSGCGTASAAQF